MGAQGDGGQASASGEIPAAETAAASAAGNVRPDDVRIDAREPVEVLTHSHDRIRHFTTVALRLARSVGASPRLITDSASALRRYFGSALPLHERDEEECVAPKLLEARRSKHLEHVLARVAGDHRAIDEALAPLDELWARVIARPATLVALSEQLHTRARALASLFESHLQLEEETVFPALALLPERTREHILREIRDRRTSGTLTIRPPAPKR